MTLQPGSGVRVAVIAIAAVLAAAGCTARAGGRAPAEAKPRPAEATSEAGAARGPAPDAQMIDAITSALRRGDVDAAGAAVERARRASPSARPSAENLAYYDAAVHAYRGDYRGAAAVMYDHIATVGPTAAAAFYFHDAMIALRTADGDLLGALVECEEMTRAGTLGTWVYPEGDRMTLVRLKEHWHRAYLLRMIAQTLAEPERHAFVDYAERARRDYVALAGTSPDLHDSIAVLDAYFAYCDGDRARMREAARRVDVAQDDDVEDLYLVQLALDGAGDADAAASVRRHILASAPVTVLTPVFLDWMRADAAPAEQPRRFSPKHPTGARRAP